MSRLLLKPWDLTASERERVIETLRTVRPTWREIAESFIGVTIINLPVMVYVGCSAVGRLKFSPWLYPVLFLVPMPLVILLNIRIARRRVPRAIRLTWEDTGPPVCPACGYRIADLPDAAACPECGEHWIIDNG